MYTRAIDRVKEEGGKVLYGGKVLRGAAYKSGCYVTPTIVEALNHYQMVQEETFAPILYIMQYEKIEEAVAMQNDVKTRTQLCDIYRQVARGRIFPQL